jgi:hypothetical protein
MRFCRALRLSEFQRRLRQAVNILDTKRPAMTATGDSLQ